ncbi:MAG: ABC transporter ATP-binding protein [Pirellulaceae bacterium]|nr:ABC transporter ATP-binding protein [Pirellulaceae bacterium]
MKPFFRIVYHALRYKWSIAGATIASLLIAILWGASMTTVYPVVEVVLDGQTAQSWVVREISKSETTIENLEQEVAILWQEQANLTGAELVSNQARIDKSTRRIEAETKALAWYVWAKPYIETYSPATPFKTLVFALAWLVSTSLIKGVLLIISTYLVARVANRTVADLRRVYYRKALEMDQQRVDTLGTSNIMTHLSHNMLMISAGLQAFYGRLIREPLKMIACLAWAAWISFPLLLISLATLPAGALVIRRLTKSMKRSTAREIEGMSHVFQTLMETLGALKTVRIFNRETSERRRFKGNAQSLYRISQKIAFFDSLIRPITELLSIIAIAMAILAGAYLVLNQETHIFNFKISDRPLSPGQLLLFFTMLAGASDPARKMSEVINQLIRGGLVAESLLKTYDVEPQVVARVEQKPVPIHTELIEFKNVAFGYQPKNQVVKGVSFSVPFGQAVAIVGGNGCGKSTLMNLLARFYDVQQGEILIDGVDIRDVHPRKLRRQIAWVTQDACLFKGTIWQNIAYGSKTATDEDIKAAADLAMVTAFVKTMPRGFETQVGDNGRQLSSGQRQRVALARAVLANPQILILDEATSQIDGKTETVLHEGLAHFIRSRTTFVVTHRVTSLKLTDRILIMEAGEVVFDGPTEEAREHSDVFRFLFHKAA